MVEKEGAERRRSERFAMGFKIRIHEARDSGWAFIEDTVLHDVSGVGIAFVTHKPQVYRTGQRLRVSILLPGTDHLEARLEGDATVVRIGQATEGASFVGVSMDDPLEFVSAVQSAPSDRDAGGGA